MTPGIYTPMIMNKSLSHRRGEFPTHKWVEWVTKIRMEAPADGAAFDLREWSFPALYE